MKRTQRVALDKGGGNYTVGSLAKVGKNWYRLLKADPIEWLLDPGNPSVRYWTLIDLLDRPRDDPAVQQAAAQIGEMPLVLYILGRRNRKGLWGEEKDYYTPKHYSTFWVLSILGDLGMSADSDVLRRAIDYMLAQQREDGAFRRGQITTGHPEIHPMPCTHSRILRFLVQFGYGGHPAVQRGIDWLITSQREDGSWICDPTREHRHGCLRATHDYLRLASLLPAHRQHPSTAKAATWLADRLLDPRVGRFKVANLWLTFTFPNFGYHLLSATDALASLGYGPEHPKMAEAARAILAKQADHGPWLIDAEPDRPPVHFGKAGEPGKWVTLDALRALKRLFDPPTRSDSTGRAIPENVRP